jgi:proteasome accessory factor C
MKSSPANAAEQLKRLLTLIPRIADGEEHSVSDIAGKVGVSSEQVFDDLRTLVDRFDTPGGFVDGVQIYHEGNTVSVVTPHFLRPMRLTMAELCALELGLAILRSERTGAELAPIERALIRLRTVIPSTLVAPLLGVNSARDLHLENTMTGAAPAGAATKHLSALRQAVRQKRKARLLYRRGSSAATEARVVCPYCLVFATGSWYVVAHCERAKALRVFRLDRISDVTADESTYEVPDNFSIDRVLEKSKAVTSKESEEVLRVKYSPRIAKWIAEREGVTLAEDESATIEHPLHDDQWAVRHVLQYGPEAEVIAPQRIRAKIAKALRQ